MEPRVSLITLGVRDLDRALRFYRDGLGLPLRPESVDNEIAFFDMGRTWLALWGRDKLAADAGVPSDAGAAARVALAHNVRSREAVDAVLAEAAAAGATITRPAHDAEWGGYTGHFADPDGHLWEVAWNPGFDLTS